MHEGDLSYNAASWNNMYMYIDNEGSFWVVI